MNLPFLEELVESRAFTDGSTIHGKSAKDIAEIIMLMTLVLEILHIDHPAVAIEYVEKTLLYPDFTAMKSSATDYGNLAAVLANQTKYHDKITVNLDISMPVMQFKRYLKDIKYNSSHHSQDRAFFMTLEESLKVSMYKSYRRIIGDWAISSNGEKQAVISNLVREFSKKSVRSDIYVAFKHIHNP